MSTHFQTLSAAHTHGENSQEQSHVIYKIKSRDISQATDPSANVKEIMTEHKKSTFPPKYYILPILTRPYIKCAEDAQHLVTKSRAYII